MRLGRKTSLLMMAVMMGAGSIAYAQQRKTPYWASISAGQARMRTGPGQQFPVKWVYQRQGLPVKVVKTYPNWRLVADPSGDQGWMQANLLSDGRTGMVMDDVRALHERADAESRVLWRAEPGVVGKLSECSPDWCRMDVLGRMGYIRTSEIYGD